MRVEHFSVIPRINRIFRPIFSRQKTLQNKSMCDITIEILTDAGRKAVGQHLIDVFCVDEPMFRSNNWIANDRFIKSDSAMIDSGISLKAVNGDGQIVGIVLADIMERNTVS